MILNNFYICMEYFFCAGLTQGGGTNRYKTIPGLLNTAGEQPAVYQYWYNSQSYDATGSEARKIVCNHTPFYDLFIQVGTSTAEPTVNDYALTATFSGTGDSSSINTINRTDTGWKIKATYTAHNTTSSDITITEAGIGKHIQAYDTNNDKFLFAKTLLDIPVTIPPNESRTICLDWDISM